MRNIRMGMHGFGYIGRIHVASLALYNCVPGNTAPVEWKSVSVRQLDSQSGLDAKRYFSHVTCDWAEVLRKVDVVDITSPNDLHAEAVVDAVHAGIPVYCEKPLSHDIQKARQMVDAVERAGVTNQVALLYRFHPAVEQAYHLLRSGRMGRAFTFRALLLHGGYLDSERPMSWRLRNEHAGAGALMDLGVHMLDLILFLLGPSAEVDASLHTFVSSRPIHGSSKSKLGRVDVDDWAHVQLRMTNGAVGTVEVSRMHYGLEDAFCDIVCERGTLHLPLTQQGPVEVHWLNHDNTETPDDVQEGMDSLTQFRIPPKYSTDGLLIGHAAGLTTFLHRVCGGDVDYPVPTFRDALFAEELVSAAKQSAVTKKAIPLGLRASKSSETENG